MFCFDWALIVLSVHTQTPRARFNFVFIALRALAL